MFVQKIDSPLGSIVIMASDMGITHVEINKEENKMTLGPSNTHTEAAVRQFEEYFGGKRKVFELTYDLKLGKPLFNNNALFVFL